MNIQKNTTFLVQIFKNYISTRHYCDFVKVGKPQEYHKIRAESNVVETDTHKLASEVCGTNIYIEGGENVKIKPDSEYPDWLWKAHFGAPLPLEKLDPTTKEYWYKVRALRLKEWKDSAKYQRHKTVQK